MKKTPSPISQGSPQQRAVLLRGLARLLASGIAPDRAIAMLGESSDPAERNLVERMHAGLSAGSGLAASIAAAGLLSGTEATVAAAAEHGGNLEVVLDQIATKYERRDALRRQVKARLVLPAAVVLLAALLAPLPGLFAQRYGAVGYLLRAAGVLAVPAALAALFATPRVRYALGRMAQPFAGPWFADYRRRDYLDTLTLALASGMPALEAIDLATSTLPSPMRHGAAGGVKRDVMNGATVADALREAGLITAAGLALATAGEQSGALESMLQRQVKALNDSLADREQTLATWAPRLAYALAVGAAASAMLGA
ncbi:MAG: type II secretion system F family protein [Pseudomonadota bacterium]